LIDKEAFPELFRLGNIAVSLPVSAASCKRSFSCLRHVKTWVRTEELHLKCETGQRRHSSSWMWENAAVREWKNNWCLCSQSQKQAHSTGVKSTFENCCADKAIFMCSTASASQTHK